MAQAARWPGLPPARSLDARYRTGSAVNGASIHLPPFTTPAIRDRPEPLLGRPLVVNNPWPGGCARKGILPRS
jgi:hypothetical protein